MFPYLFLVFHMDLSKFLIVLFCAFTICENINVIHKTYYTYIKTYALIAIKKVCVIE
jgi:hypothetical protein